MQNRNSLYYPLMKRGRRDFLKLSLTSLTACGVARSMAATNKSARCSITDTHVYVGHWPHQTLSGEASTKLIDQLSQSGVAQAWTGNFDGLFHKDVAAVNERLANTCAKLGDGMLIPFGTVNPTLPDWEDDIRRCHESFHMPGIRLHPNYHGYKLDDPRFSRVLELATARGLIVQLVAWLESQKHFLLSPSATQVGLKPLADKAALPKLKMLVIGSDWRSDAETIRRLSQQKQIYFDCTRAQSSADIRRLVEMATSARVVFGSGTPLHDIEASVARLREAKLSDNDWKSVALKSAGRLLAISMP
jgi:predicted TIM-barrel fold metal-dependent hydrolase